MYPTSLDNSWWDVDVLRTIALLMALRMCLWGNSLRGATWHQTATDNICDRGLRHQGLALVNTPVNIPWRYFAEAKVGGGGAVLASTHCPVNLVG